MIGRRKRSKAPVIAPPAVTEVHVQEVVRGGVRFAITRTHVQCLRCSAIVAVGGDVDGEAARAFFVAHTHTITESSPARDRVLAALDELGVDELEVVAEVCDGLKRGRAVYGELQLASDRRDFDRELLDEARDGLAYAAMTAVRRRRQAVSR